MRLSTFTCVRSALALASGTILGASQSAGQAPCELAKLTASDAAVADYFGFSVSVSGEVAVVGAIGDDDAGSWSGSAYVFRRVGTTWVQEQKLTASGAATSDQFGFSAAVTCLTRR